MTKRTNLFPKLTCPREMHFLKIAGISLRLFCTTSQIAVADTYETYAVTATQQSKTEKLTGKIVDENGEAIIGASVKVQGSTIGTITNLEGEFTLSNAPRKAVLENQLHRIQTVGNRYWKVQRFAYHHGRRHQDTG